MQLSIFTVVAIVEGPFPLPQGKGHLVKSERGVGGCAVGRQGAGVGRVKGVGMGTLLGLLKLTNLLLSS